MRDVCLLVRQHSNRIDPRRPACRFDAGEKRNRPSDNRHRYEDQRIGGLYSKEQAFQAAPRECCGTQAEREPDADEHRPFPQHEAENSVHRIAECEADADLTSAMRHDADQHTMRPRTVSSNAIPANMVERVIASRCGATACAVRSLIVCTSAIRQVWIDLEQRPAQAANHGRGIQLRRGNRVTLQELRQLVKHSGLARNGGHRDR